MLEDALNEKLKTLKFPDNFKAKLELILKNGKVHEVLIENKFENNFTQVNNEVNNILKKLVLNSLDLNKNKKDLILELYCGNGNFTFGIAKTSFVMALDTHVPNGKYKNIEFIKTNIDKNLHLLSRHNFNKLLLDPPRKGITFNNLNKLLINDYEQIVYVSCNPHSLIADAIKLKNYNYTWQKVALLDMFPYTEHIESVNIFRKI